MLHAQAQHEAGRVLAGRAQAQAALRSAGAVTQPAVSTAGAVAGSSGSDSSESSSPHEHDATASRQTLSQLLPFHVNIGVSVKSCKMQLLDEMHPGMSDARAAPAALAFRQKRKQHGAKGA